MRKLEFEQEYTRAVIHEHDEEITKCSTEAHEFLSESLFGRKANKINQ